MQRLRTRTGRRAATPRIHCPQLELLALAAIVATPTETIAIARDPDDNRLNEAGQADVIVTGDHDLLTLGRVGQIGILTPRGFLEAQEHGT